MPPNVPAMDRDLKGIPNGAGGGGLGAVLGHTNETQQPIRNSFCCGGAVIACCAKTYAQPMCKPNAFFPAAITYLPSKYKYIPVDL